MAVYLSLTEPLFLFFTDFIWRIIAIALVMVASLLVIWAISYFKTIRRIFGMEVVKLVTEGPYRYTRHPQYIAIFLYTLALVFLLNTVQALAYAISVSFSFYIVALMEERKLAELFAEQYLSYKEKTPIIPFLRHVRRK